MKNKIIRNKRLKKIITQNYSENGSLIYFLIVTNSLNEVIQHLDNIRTFPNSTSLIKKGYLTSEEQFIDVLKYIISRFNIDFWFLRKNGNTIIKYILTCEETLPLLFSKKYVGDSKFCSYYTLEYKKSCIMNFYKILKSIEKTNIIVSFLEENKIDLKNFDTNSNKDVDSLYQALRLLCLCNCNSFGLLYLFDGNINERNKNMYCIQLEMLIEKSFQLKDIANQFLEAIY